ncbi:MAG: hypothetical protein VCE91_18410 [Nitrospinota bacterium]
MAAIFAGRSGAAPERGLNHPKAVPRLDTKKRSVALENVVFDTFNGSFVRLS